MRGLDPGGDLHRQLQRFVQRQGTAVEPVGERLALDVFQNEIPGPVLLLDAVDAGEVDVAQRGERLRLALEALQANGVLGEMLGELLDRDVAVQPRVAGEMHDTHAAAADFPDDLVGADLVVHWQPSTLCRSPIRFWPVPEKPDDSIRGSRRRGDSRVSVKRRTTDPRASTSDTSSLENVSCEDPSTRLVRRMPSARCRCSRFAATDD